MNATYNRFCRPVRNMERLYINHLLASKLHYSHIYLVDGEKHNPGHVARLGAWGD